MSRLIFSMVSCNSLCSSFSIMFLVFTPLLEAVSARPGSSDGASLCFDPLCLRFLSFLSFFFFFFLSIEDFLSTEDSSRDDYLDFLCFLVLASSEFSRATYGDLCFSSYPSTVPGLDGSCVIPSSLTLCRLSIGVALVTWLSF